MNIYTVAKATVLTFATNGIKAHLFEDLRPTPEFSFTVRELKCSGGIVITVSHNTKQYNGYKVYGDDGEQITHETAKEIIGYINNLHIFDDVKTMDEKEVLDKGLLSYIGENIEKEYFKNVKALVIRKDLKIIYTLIHGSGNKPVIRVLHELGFKNVKVVKEQEKSDGNFPTASYPNLEDKSVFKLVLEIAKTENQDIIFGTYPDCDRIGGVVKDNSGEYKVLT